MRSTDIKFDVTSATGIDEPIYVAGTLHLPDQVASGGKLDLLFALHGGGYPRSYWHPTYVDESYSFARYFTDRGKAVLAVDHLGMGDSSKPEPESKLSRVKIAAANAQALAETVRGLTSGKYAKASHVSVTGIGHSMGGMLVITQAAAHQDMDRVAVVGWANLPVVLGDVNPETMLAGLPPYGYAPPNASKLRSFFFLPDVPADVIAADEAHRSVTPICLGRDAMTRDILRAESASIAKPILVVQSVVDTSPDPLGELAFFKSSKDVTLSILDNAAHCQNFASTRKQHWARLDSWIGG